MNPSKHIQSAAAAYPPSSAVNVVSPPGLPTMDRDDQGFSQNSDPVETKSRVNGFWKGCSSILRCCDALKSCCDALESCYQVLEICNYDMESCF